MSSITKPDVGGLAPRVDAQSAADQQSGARTSSLAFDWVMAGLGFLFVLGLYIDGWAHNHLAQIVRHMMDGHNFLNIGADGFFVDFVKHSKART